MFIYCFCSTALSSFQTDPLLLFDFTPFLLVSQFLSSLSPLNFNTRSAQLHSASLRPALSLSASSPRLWQMASSRSIMSRPRPNSAPSVNSLLLSLTFGFVHKVGDDTNSELRKRNEKRCEDTEDGKYGQSHPTASGWWSRIKTKRQNTAVINDSNEFSFSFEQPCWLKKPRKFSLSIPHWKKALLMASNQQGNSSPIISCAVKLIRRQWCVTCWLSCSRGELFSTYQNVNGSSRATTNTIS